MTMKSITALTCVVLLGAAVPAQAVDCNVNVFDAYNTAKLRGWEFKCHPPLGMTGGFVPYPAPTSGIGCAYKTPPVVGPVTAFARVDLFVHTGDRPELKNGWKVKSYEISGGQWQNVAVPGKVDDRIRIAFFPKAAITPNRTYNYILIKLTLTRSGGSCAKAIGEAF
jgi:hypothetical protein